MIFRLLSIFALFCSTITVSAASKEATYIKHVKESIKKAKGHVSKLDGNVFQVHGYSSYKVRHLLNNVCSLQNGVYLEVGSWKGSTFIAALYENQKSLKDAIAVDNFSEFGGDQEVLVKNCRDYLKENYSYRFIFQDCFAIDNHSQFPYPINIFFFDGNHSYESQAKAFSYFNEIFDDVFIAIVDDWNFSEVSSATKSIFRDLNYTVLFEEILPSNGNSDMINWWNGLYIAVIRK